MNDRSREESIANGILVEYRGLHESLQSLEGLSATRQPPDSNEVPADRVAEHLRSVREHMKRLFEYEEQGGFFRDLLDLLPAESPGIEAVKEEHPRLLARIDVLIATMGEDHVTDLESLRTEIRSFSNSLEGHEHRERNLLRRSYYLEEGTVD